jgi:hypothetical protein
MVNEPFPIDLSDPADIVAKMPEIRRLYSQKRQELKALGEQVELLGRLVGEKPAARPSKSGQATKRKVRRPSKAGQNAPAQDRVVAGLERANRPMGPASLYRFMIEEGMKVPKDSNALGSNLWSAWKAARIMKAPNGVYTLLDGSGKTEHDHPITDYDAAAENGFPVPSAPVLRPNSGVIVGHSGGQS